MLFLLMCAVKMFKLVVLVQLFYAVLCSASQTQNNVCKNLDDYLTISNNQNCWYNPDVQSHPALIAKRHGFHLEKYKVVTDDGYILSVFRIVHNATDLKNNRPPIVLQHGIGITAAAFMLNGVNSAAYYLVNKGFDVWLPNIRGTVYSLGHSKYTTEDPDYWNFSFHEMGIYDLPAVLDFISKTIQRRDKIIYVGHSMGTTISYVYASLRKDNAEKNLKSLVSVAPVAYMKYISSIVKYMVPFMDQIENFLYDTGIERILRYPHITQNLFRTFCTSPTFINICEILHIYFAGFNPIQLAPEKLPSFFGHFLAGNSLKTIIHFAQIIQNNGRFQWYDYGIQQNKIVYNSSTPPEYKVDEIRLPVHLLYGIHDYLADEKDVDTLYEKLTSRKSKTLVAKNNMFHFAHNDFLLGKYADIFNELLLEAILS